MWYFYFVLEIITCVVDDKGSYDYIVIEIVINEYSMHARVLRDGRIPDPELGASQLLPTFLVDSSPVLVDFSSKSMFPSLSL